MTIYKDGTYKPYFKESEDNCSLSIKSSIKLLAWTFGLIGLFVMIADIVSKSFNISVNDTTGFFTLVLLTFIIFGIVIVGLSKLIEGLMNG